MLPETKAFHCLLKSFFFNSVQHNVKVLCRSNSTNKVVDIYVRTLVFGEEQFSVSQSKATVMSSELELSSNDLSSIVSEEKGNVPASHHWEWSKPIIYLISTCLRALGAYTNSYTYNFWNQWARTKYLRSNFKIKTTWHLKPCI